jgi:hypothetical protein
MDRHTRQTRLVDVGPEGQARLARAEVEVPGRDLAAMVAARYLAGAGVARLLVEDARVAAAARAVDPRVAVDVVPPSVGGSPRGDHSDDGFTDPSARAVATGAMTALAAIARALREAS